MSSSLPVAWRPAALGTVLALVLLAPARAADAPAVIVTGSVLPRTVGTELASSSVLTRADLERAGVRDLVAALSLLGSALPQQLGGPGTQTALRLRGADTRDTLVLVDGVALTDVTTGASSIASIAVDDVERIEVVRGNLSALHGGNAAGGVVQIFTRRGSASPTAALHTGAGTRGTVAAGASVGGGSAALATRLTLSGERSRGFSALDAAQVAAANPDADGYRRRNATLALDAAPAEGHRVAFDARWLRGDVAYDSSFGAPADRHDAEIEQRGVALRGRHALAPAWSLAWRLAGIDERRLDTEVSAFGTSSFGNRLHNRDVMVEASGSLAGSLALQVAAERLRQSTDNATYTRRARRTDTLRVGLSDDARWGGWQLGVRHDDSSDHGGATTWLAGSRIVLAPAWSAFASASTSFTPPTLDFLFFDCTPFGFVCANPDLRPERGRSAEVALQWQAAAARVRATLFAARHRDKIVADADFVPRNVGRTRNRGLELVADGRWGHWRAAGEWLWQQPENADSGERLTLRARHQASLRVGRDIGAFALDATLRHVGARPDGAVTLPSATVVGVAAGWRPAPGWRIAASVDNVFDRDDAPAAGYRGRPRGAFVRVDWQP